MEEADAKNNIFSNSFKTPTQPQKQSNTISIENLMKTTTYLNDIKIIFDSKKKKRNWI
jgi:hypothetical protein